MVTYDRSESDGARIAAEWEGGISWIAHPEEEGQRASHAISTARTASGVCWACSGDRQR